jgi:hypothetical protein
LSLADCSSNRPPRSFVRRAVEEEHLFERRGSGLAGNFV